jgi:hypothetical protein
MEPTTEKHEARGEGSGEDGDREKRVRDAIVYGLSISSGVATYAIGFDILPSSTTVEKALIFLTALGVTGAVIAGIGAWHSFRRFIFMAASAGMAFVFIAALSVAAQQSATGPQAQGATSPVTPAGDGTIASDASSGSPATAPASSSSLGTPNAPAVLSTNVPKYRNQPFEIPGGGCQVTNVYSYVIFGAQQPEVTASAYSGDGGPPTPYDLVLDCTVDPAQIDFGGQTAVVSGNPGAAACDAAIHRHPLAGNSFPFTQLNKGEQFCMINDSGDELVMVTLLSMSNTSYDTTWSATAWSIPANS